MCAARRHDATEASQTETDGIVGRAEALRRAGQPLAAERMIRSHLLDGGEGVAARSVLCLALLDQGRHDDAYRELESALDELFEAPSDAAAGIAGEEISALELDRAFADARAEPEQMIDANRLAEDAMLEADLAVPEGFKTATMADLLEDQGDLDGAERIRAAIAAERHQRREEAAANATGSAGAVELDAPVRDGETLATLERWLRKLRGTRT